MCLVATILDTRVLDSYIQLLFEISTWVFPGYLKPNRVLVNFNCPIPNQGPPSQYSSFHKSNHLIAQVKTLMSPSTPLFPSLPMFNPSARHFQFLSTSFCPNGLPVQATSFCHLDNSDGLLALFLFPLFLNLFIYLFIYLYLAVLGLCCCTWALPRCGEQGLLSIVVRRSLITVASVVVEHRL